MSIYVDKEDMEVVLDVEVSHWERQPMYTLEYGPWMEGYFACPKSETTYLETMNYLSGIFKVVYTNSFDCQYDYIKNK